MSRIPINPLVDFAFKKVLGDPANTDILIDFLNSILHLRPPITAVEIQNPFNPQDFETDKLTVVDVKARDDHGRTYQIEVQVQVHSALPARVLYSWARTHIQQIHIGDHYQLLRPTLSIWILDALLFPQSLRVHHRFLLMDPDTGMQLTDHIELHVLQLKHFRMPAALDEEARWVYFLKEARNWTELPASLDCPALRKAMNKLDAISESTADRLRYQAREEYLLEQATLEHFRKEALEDLKQTQEALGQTQEALGQAQEALEQTQEALQQAERARNQAEEARRQAEDREARLLALLRAAGVDPTS